VDGLQISAICFQFVIENLAGNRHYVIKVSAGTKSLSNPDKTWVGEMSDEVEVYLPAEKCRPGIFEADFRGELSAGMIVGAVCAVLFLFLAVIGFVIWRYASGVPDCVFSDQKS
jgi:hypothetical protein